MNERGINGQSADLFRDALVKVLATGNVASEVAKPVMFPPGRSRRGTKPMATGSPVVPKTIGIVRVSRWRATVTGVEPVSQGRRERNYVVR